MDGTYKGAASERSVAASPTWGPIRASLSSDSSSWLSSLSLLSWQAFIEQKHNVKTHIHQFTR